MDATELQQLGNGLALLQQRKLQDQAEFVQKASEVMDALWTPFAGHKISLRASVEKWRVLLLIAQLAQGRSASELEKTRWFVFECQLAFDLKCFA